MKELLSERIHSTILYIPDDQDYEPTYEICKITQDRTSNLDLQLEKNNNTIKKLNEIKEKEPEKAKTLLDLGRQASSLRKEKHISIESITIRRPLFLRLLYTLLIVFTLPYTLSVSILTLPMVLVCKYIFTLLKDPAFKNSVRFLIYLLLWPLLMIVYSIIIYNLLPWQIALFTTLILLPAPIIAHEISRILRIIISDIKLRKAKHLRKLHEQIREMMKG
jgi:hypothetical protein